MSSSAPALRPGDQLASTVCATRVVVVRAPAGAGPALACGGSPMVPANSARPRPAASGEPVTLLGKRYVDAAGTLELLCTSAGTGELSCDGEPMTLKTAKPLPASD
ncbi:hypothetical protein FPZ12_028195 [Amycolatopsis acidicola]|uniref:Uncharacterized protein n=1 Tax=Amycolatopsis acidicola TaxID=2596893 RepID=A0A5N0UY26_9PSEU|nr:hypothetical protein [Amycolatopsis acidicola]KAA9156208.1 hypothetical protein FPZ12_028195 [Amycolatopsis acidicola]